MHQSVSYSTARRWNVPSWNISGSCLGWSPCDFCCGEFVSGCVGGRGKGGQACTKTTTNVFGCSFSFWSLDFGSVVGTSVGESLNWLATLVTYGFGMGCSFVDGSAVATPTCRCRRREVAGRIPELYFWRASWCKFCVVLFCCRVCPWVSFVRLMLVECLGFVCLSSLVCLEIVVVFE